MDNNFSAIFSTCGHASFYQTQELFVLRHVKKFDSPGASMIVYRWTKGLNTTTEYYVR